MTTPLDAALEAAFAAGDVLRRKFPHTREVKSKGWRDIVTDADLAAHHVIVNVLVSRFPDFALLSEEGRHEAQADLAAAVPTWVIDPLDGTTNYARQFPAFGVSIALAQNSEIQLGVVHDPLRRDTFFAERGQGAVVQNEQGTRQPARASDLSAMGDALMGVDWPRDPALRQRAMDAARRVAAECRTVRAIGSAALGLAYVAAGWLDGYYHLSLQPWDVAAGALIVTEAGGRISAPDGSAWQVGGGQIVASNGLLHERLLRTLALG